MSGTILVILVIWAVSAIVAIINKDDGDWAVVPGVLTVLIGLGYFLMHSK